MAIVAFIGHIYFLILPAIVGGVLNMVFVKLPVLRSLQVPMDGGRVLKDGRRIFGDNKTWKGFFGMIVLSALSAWAFWRGAFPYPYLCGAWLGLAYVLFELPNSFIKRRLDISAGKNGGVVQTFFDQADSVIGYILFLPLVYPETLIEAAGIFVIATATHYVVNIALFFVKLRGQKG
ncbi:MAG: CDP-archaeol synthase [Eggerthellaceae bacterium]|nr:CDP-archaeol synthase [Eggerthellaceae bacterium]